MLAIGDILDGKYKILNEIGHGGMSTVYLAINEKANKTWAVKEVRKNGQENFHVVKQSLIMEIEMLKKLKSPNLPSIVDIIDTEEDFFIVMDFIEGNSLEDYLQEKKRLSQEEVVSLAKQLGSVLKYLHEQTPPIIYRDLKPSNIMRKSDGTVVLVDFGTAREYKEEKLEDTTCLGTRGYAAPEQFGGMGQTDARTDIYALGVTMYYLLTGKSPALPPYEIYPIRHWDSTLSSGLEHIILKCTNNNPKNRNQTFADFLYDIEHYRDFDQSALKKYKRQLTVFFSMLSIGVVCGLAGAGLLLTARQKQQDTYQNHISVAKRSTDQQDKIQHLKQAISISPEKQEAYTLLCESFQEDGIFSVEEEQEVVRLATGTSGYLDKWKEKEPELYADFCFTIGNTYWFYYEHEENRQTFALSWFEEARDIYELTGEETIRKNRCELFGEIGMFYKRVFPAQLEGSDAGMYKAYWENLKTLKEENDRAPDRELITLRLYREMVCNSMEYANYLMDDGVSREDIQKVYAQIKTDMEKMESHSAHLKSEITNLYQYMEDAQRLLNSTYGLEDKS